jgi:hypothetical protein
LDEAVELTRKDIKIIRRTQLCPVAFGAAMLTFIPGFI